MRVELQEAYVLHARPYRDTSSLIEILTPDYGRVSVVARGLRGGNRAAAQKRAFLQPLQALLLSWSGRGELKTLGQVESNGVLPALGGGRLFSALYANELLMRLVPKLDEQRAVFAHYRQLLQGLAGPLALETALRRFELALLESLGYGVSFECEADTGELIDPQAFYRCDPQRGFIRCRQNDTGASFSGHMLLAMARDEFPDEFRKAAKQLSRLLLADHLGDRPLQSRALFA